MPKLPLPHEEPDGKVICIDFDGVLHDYTSWNNGELNGPVQYASEASKCLADDGYLIIIHTTRGAEEVEGFLESHCIFWHLVNENPFSSQMPDPPRNLGKPRADIYIDDRAIRFDGRWSNTLDEINRFSPWWKRRK